MGFSDYRINTWLGQLRGIWIALHYDNPEVAGAYASELFSGSYARQAASLGPPSNRGIYVINDITFGGLPDTRITYLGGWDAQYSGNLEFSVILPAPIIAIAGSSKTFPANTIALSID
jgi:hypothetical protein